MHSTYSNKEIGKVLILTAELMELHGYNPFRARSYANAGISIERNEGPIAIMNPSEIAKIKGIGEAIQKSISEFITTGSFSVLEELLAETPPGVIDILKLKGIGPKKVKMLWKELGVESPGELLYACNENRLITLDGFGVKTQENIKKNLEYLIAHQDLRLFIMAEAEALEIEKLLHTCPHLVFARTGELRRQSILISKLEYLCYNLQDLDFLCEKHQFLLSSESAASRYLKSTLGTSVCFYSTDDKNFARDLLETTGPEVFIVQNGFADLPRETPFVNEEAIFSILEKKWIAPELRDHPDVFSFRDTHREDDLISEKDIKGVVHTHSHWSDGTASLQEMARACNKMGYEYLVISDHSRAAFYANGLSEERVLQQHQEIDRLNLELAPFRIIKSIEADILADGQLDYSQEFLRHFEIVIASVHSVLRMDEAKANARLIKAIENPATGILGHLTGRLLLSREGYPINHPRIIDACAANGVAIELNANPHRLDIDYKWINYCQKKGVWISINPDAHSLEGIGHIRYGVIAARKGLLLARNTLNTKGINDFLEHFNRKQLKD